MGCGGPWRRAPLDGVLLALHGAMVTEIDDDGDGYILQIVREIVGPDVPVVATLDLHANISPRMVELADVLIGYDTYPHIDMAERGEEATRSWLDSCAASSTPRRRCASRRCFPPRNG